MLKLPPLFHRLTGVRLVGGCLVRLNRSLRNDVLPAAKDRFIPRRRKELIR